MTLLQVVFSMLLSCLIGYNNPEALALVIVGSLLPNLDESDRYYGDLIGTKGITHSLLLILSIFISSIWLKWMFFIGVGITGHVLIELLSKESKIELFWPIKERIHFPVFSQYQSVMFWLSLVIVLILLYFFIDFVTIVDIGIVYLTWIKEIVYFIMRIFQFIAYRIAELM